MATRLDPLRDVPCTYPDCAHSFDSIREMKQHKVDCSTHFYCKTCDVDCESWVDFTQHKVDAMAPYLQSSKKKGTPKHIVCEFCGEDFKSFGGREIHRKRVHPAKQNIVCPGCLSTFVRAALMVQHLEKNQCSTISAYDFRIHIEEKYRINELLENPVGKASVYNLPTFKTEDQQSLLDTQTQTEADKATNVDTASQYSEEESSGGVSLLDTESVTQFRGRKLMRSNVSSSSNAYGSQVTTRVSYKEKWPSLEAGPVRQNIESLVVNNKADEGAWPDLPGQKTLTALNRLTIKEVNTQSTGTSKIATLEQRPAHVWQSGKTGQALFPQAQDKHVMQPIAWTEGSKIANLFPEAKPTPPDQTALAFLEQQGKAGCSMIDHKQWSVRSAGYNPAKYYNALIDRYCCPYPKCQETDGFELADDLSAHLLTAHTKTNFQCPACLKIFEKPSSLIAHAESGGQCRISEADQFMKLVGDISGGFLKAKQLPVQALVRPELQLLHGSMPVDGIMQTKYKATLPEDVPVPIPKINW